MEWRQMERRHGESGVPWSVMGWGAMADGHWKLGVYVVGRLSPTAT